MRETEYVQTGVFATKEEIEKINRLWASALNTPVMMMGENDMAADARKSVCDYIHNLAVGIGLPRRVGLLFKKRIYGMNLKSGEFFYEK